MSPEELVNMQKEIKGLSDEFTDTMRIGLEPVRFVNVANKTIRDHNSNVADSSQQ